jgi:hypothetical protein
MPREPKLGDWLGTDQAEPGGAHPPAPESARLSSWIDEPSLRSDNLARGYADALEASPSCGTRPIATRWFAALPLDAPCEPREPREPREPSPKPAAPLDEPVRGASTPRGLWVVALALPSVITLVAARSLPLRVLAGLGVALAVALFVVRVRRVVRARPQPVARTASPAPPEASRWGAAPPKPPARDSGAGGPEPSRWGAAPSGRGLALDGERLSFFPRRETPGAPSAGRQLLLLDEPFGVTLLASPRRDQVIAVLSSGSGTFYLGAAFDAPARRAFAPLLERCFTVIGDDVGMAAIGPDGEPLLLASDELASLLDALVEVSPACLEGLVSTDARGDSILLDGRHLRVGERAVDLGAPLEWKPIVFQEAFGQAVAVYQGTWIRQSSTELTLVSLLPALGPAPGADLDLTSVDRGVLRDLRLMQASPESPPPTEQRVAIDRLFMLPVRHALDGAPRITREEHPARA